MFGVPVSSAESRCSILCIVARESGRSNKGRFARHANILSGDGQQFKARFMRTSAPTSIDVIEKYLGSGMIRGIGPVYAKKPVRAFGEKVFDTIEAEPDRLRGDGYWRGPRQAHHRCLG
jgi:hypothetical protein